MDDDDEYYQTARGRYHFLLHEGEDKEERAKRFEAEEYKWPKELLGLIAANLSSVSDVISLFLVCKRFRDVLSDAQISFQFKQNFTRIKFFCEAILVDEEKALVPYVKTVATVPVLPSGKSHGHQVNFVTERNQFLWKGELRLLSREEFLQCSRRAIKCYECFWNDGKKDGTETAFYIDEHSNSFLQGPIRSTLSFKNGKKEGEEANFSRTGQKVYSCKYKNGQKHGSEIQWTDTGVQVYCTKWDEGRGGKMQLTFGSSKVA